MADTTVTTALTPKTDTTGSSVAVRQFKITDIPAAMDKMGWPVAAKLMRHWFDGAPWPTADGGMDPEVKDHRKIAPAQYTDETIISMEWALQYQKTKDAVDALRVNWNNAKALPQIAKAFNMNFGTAALGTYRLCFKGSGIAADAFGYFNFRKASFSMVGDTVDELRGALGDYNVKVIAEGVLTVAEDRYQFAPDKLGYYINDSYDFADTEYLPSQPLGFWNFDGLAMSVSAALMNNIGVDTSLQGLMVGSLFGSVQSTGKKYVDISNARYFLIQNDDFETYRKKTGRGGDFIVYSDIHYEPISTSPIVLERKRAS
jgi:hypothetical protein